MRSNMCSTGRVLCTVVTAKILLVLRFKGIPIAPMTKKWTPSVTAAFQLIVIITFTDLLLFGILPVVAADTWESEMRLSTSSGFGHGIAASGNAVHVMFGSGSVRYRRSIDHGATWSSPSIIGSGFIHLTDMIAASDPDVWLLYLGDMQTFHDWCCSRSAGNIYMSRSRDGGVTWEPEIKLTSGARAFRVSMAVSGDRVHIVWMDYQAGKWDVYYRRSADRGATWEPEVKLVPGVSHERGAGRPQIAASGDVVHVVWADGRDNTPPCASRPVCLETYYKRSTDGGASWGNDTRLTTSSKGISAHRPDVTVTSTNVVVVVYDVEAKKGFADLYVVRSTDNGGTWSSPQRVARRATHGALVTAGSQVHVAWHSAQSSSNIYYRISSDDGTTWNSAEQVNGSPGSEATTALLAVSSNYIHALWLDNRTGSIHAWYSRRDITETTNTLTP